MVSPVRRTITGLFFSFFVIVNILGTLDIPAQIILFRPQSYERALEDTSFYEHAAAWTAELIQRSVSGGSLTMNDAILANLSTGDYQVLFGSILTRDWVKLQSEVIIEQTWKFFNFEDNELHLYLEMGSAKARLQGGEGQIAASQLVMSWPECTAEQSQALIAGLQSVEAIANFPRCNPPEVVRNSVISSLSIAINSLAGRIPNVIDLASNLSINDHSRGFTAYRDIRKFLSWTPFIALALLACLAASAGSTTALTLKWLGAGIFTSGAGTALLTAIFGVSANLLLMKAYDTWLPVSGKEIGRAVQQMLATVVAQTTIACLVLAFLLGVVGLLIWTVGKRVGTDQGTRPQA